MQERNLEQNARKSSSWDRDDDPGERDASYKPANQKVSRRAAKKAQTADSYSTSKGTPSGSVNGSASGGMTVSHSPILPKAKTATKKEQQMTASCGKPHSAKHALKQTFYRGQKSLLQASYSAGTMHKDNSAIPSPITQSQVGSGSGAMPSDM